jgi:hypothetical protein
VLTKYPALAVQVPNHLTNLHLTTLPQPPLPGHLLPTFVPFENRVVGFNLRHVMRFSYRMRVSKLDLILMPQRPSSFVRIWSESKLPMTDPSLRYRVTSVNVNL